MVILTQASSEPWQQCCQDSSGSWALHRLRLIVCHTHLTGPSLWWSHPKNPVLQTRNPSPDPPMAEHLPIKLLFFLSYILVLL